jgi:four helix bundle protein
MQNFRNLKVWHKSHELTVLVYRLTAAFPKHELFGITSQLRRASSSIPANMAEGCGRGSDADFKRFLLVAMGSCNEVEYFLLLAKDLDLLTLQDHGDLQKRIEEIKRMLATLIQRLGSK